MDAPLFRQYRFSTEFQNPASRTLRASWTCLRVRILCIREGVPMRNTLRMLIGAKLRYLAPLPVPRRIRRHSGPSSWLGLICAVCTNYRRARLSQSCCILAAQNNGLVHGEGENDERRTRCPQTRAPRIHGPPRKRAVSLDRKERRPAPQGRMPRYHSGIYPHDSNSCTAPEWCGTFTDSSAESAARVTSDAA